jgi:hypothetical protein
MAGGAANSAQKFAFEHKIVLVDQLGRPRAAPVFTTQYDQPSPSGVQKG